MCQSSGQKGQQGLAESILERPELARSQGHQYFGAVVEASRAGPKGHSDLFLWFSDKWLPLLQGELRPMHAKFKDLLKWYILSGPGRGYFTEQGSLVVTVVSGAELPFLKFLSSPRWAMVGLWALPQTRW